MTSSSNVEIALKSLSGRYQMLGRIARGGMGAVHLGRELGRGAEPRVVAIKLMHPYLARDAQGVGMFLDEARLALRIRHPNVVIVRDVDMLGEEIVLVMEYHPGIALLQMQRAAAAQGM